VINESGWPDTRRGLPTPTAGFCRQSAAVFPARGVFSFRSFGRFFYTPYAAAKGVVFLMVFNYFMLDK